MSHDRTQFSEPPPPLPHEDKTIYRFEAGGRWYDLHLGVTTPPGTATILVKQVRRKGTHVISR